MMELHWARRLFLSAASTHWEPAVDFCEDDEAYHVIMDIAGVSEQDFGSHLPTRRCVSRSRSASPVALRDGLLPSFGNRLWRF
jgi:hypothetical protein